MNWWRRFVDMAKPERYVDGAGLNPDAELIARTRARQEAARDALGSKWIGYDKVLSGKQRQQLQRAFIARFKRA